MKKIIVQLTELAKNDYNNLPQNLKDECKELLLKLQKRGKNFGIALENKNGKDLRGYYKLYFDEARYRIVYTIVNEKIEITEIGGNRLELLEVVGIGKRNKEFIYNLIYQREKIMRKAEEETEND